MGGMMQWAVLLCWLTFVGCAGAPGIGDGPDRTGGVSVEVFIEDSGHSAAYYLVTADGTIGYGGAQHARRNALTWTGTLTDEQISELNSILSEHNLFTELPQPSDDAEYPKYRVRIESPAGRNRIHANGSIPPLKKLHEHLRGIAKQRFDRLLETFPGSNRK